MPTGKAIAVALTLSIIIIGTLKAQAQSDSFNIFGTFIGNGFQMTLPDGWVGRLLDENSVMAVPSESLSTQTTLEITATIGRTSISGWEWIEANAFVPGCIIASASYVEVNGGIGKVLEAECEPSGQWPYTILLIHEFLGSGENEALFFSVVWATTREVFDQNQSDLQGMIDSFLIQDVADIRQKLAELYQLQSQEKTVMVNGKEVIVNLQSASEIEDFSLDEGSEIIKFRVGDTHPAGQLTILTIGSILDGPYQLTIDGQTVENPKYYTIEDKITGQTFIVIRHDANDEVTIQGTLIAEVDTEPTQPTYIKGKYTWGDIEVVFPEGWIAISEPNINRLMAVRSDSGGQPRDAIYLTWLFPPTSSAYVPSVYFNSLSEKTCEPPQIAYMEKAGMPAKEIIERCSDGQQDAVLKTYYWGSSATLTDASGERKADILVAAQLHANSEEEFEASSEAFEKFAESVKIASPGSNIREVEHRSLGLTPIVQTVQANGTDVQVKIESNTEIQNFSLDQESKTLSFTTDGEDGTEGTTIISIASILEGPYVVSLDGQVIEEGVTNARDETTSETLLVISYQNSVHDIVITGTQVVPEFPLPFVGAIAAVVGMIALIGRFRNQEL